MYQLVYISSATKPMTERDLEDLLIEARSLNEKYNVTGMLLYYGQSFIQVIEGAKQDILQLISNIRKDPRNEDLYIIFQEDIAQREFPRWYMGFHRVEPADLSSLDGYVELHSHEDIDKYVNNAGLALGLLKAFYDRNLGLENSV